MFSTISNGIASASQHCRLHVTPAGAISHTEVLLKHVVEL